MRAVWVILLFSPALLASYCGRSGVPFSVEILSNGSPVLGCAQPTCVAVPEEGTDDAVFQTDPDGQTDGFFRDGDRNQNLNLQANKLQANCSGEFSELSCLRKNQWVGGIQYIDHPRQPLILQCCTFEGLRFSQDVGITTIAAGEAVTGGEVIRDGRQISFDVIANVRKVVDPTDHRVSYEVTVRRMNCLPDPPEVEVQYDNDISDEILRVLRTSENGAVKPSRYVQPTKRRRKRPNSNGEFAFGAPNYNPVSGPRKKKLEAEMEPESARIQPHPRTIPPGVAQSPSTTSSPRTTSTTPSPITSSAFTPVTIAATQGFLPIVQQPSATPSPMGMQQFTLPTLPPSIFGAFTLPPHPSHAFGPLPQTISLHHPFLQHQFPGLAAPTQLFGVPQPQTQGFGIGSSQLQPSGPALALGGQTNLSPLASPSYNPLQPMGLGQPFGPLSHQQTLWPFLQPAAGFGTMMAGNSPVSQHLGGLPGIEEQPEIVSPRMIQNGAIAINSQPQALPQLITPPPFNALGNSLNNFQYQG